MRVMESAAVAALLLAALPGQAAADMTVGMWKAAPSNPQTGLAAKIYLSGVQAGLTDANAAFETRGGAPLYCQPRTLALRTEQVEDILNRYITAGHGVADTDRVEVILLEALKDVFPCPMQRQ